MRIKFILFILTIFIFFGCESKINLPQIADFSQKRFIVNKNGAKSQIFVAKQDNAYRFIWLDMLGAPISKKILKDGEFKNDGFLPPNKLSEKIFLYILKNIDKKKFIIKLNNNQIYKVLDANIYE